MKDTKGVRQELEDLLLKTFGAHLASAEWDAPVKEVTDELITKLQEIMLGMLPEGVKLPSNDEYLEMVEKAKNYDDMYDSGFKFAIKLVEQNIREALKDKD
jgi:hypothetical protein